jgi:hypothetical protein
MDWEKVYREHKERKNTPDCNSSKCAGACAACRNQRASLNAAFTAQTHPGVEVRAGYGEDFIHPVAADRGDRFGAGHSQGVATGGDREGRIH